MKNLKNIILPTVILTVICAILGLGLSYTNEITKDIIASQNAQKQQDAMKSALPAFSYEQIAEIDGCVIYSATQGDPVGYVVSSSANGYGGKIEVMVGIDLGGQIYGVEIVSCDDETAGIGQKVADDGFKSGFNMINADDIQDVDTITGATISSTAVKTAVEKAYEAYESEVDGK